MSWRVVVAGEKNRRAPWPPSKRSRAPADTIGGATRKQVPRGFDADHGRAPLLLHEGLWAGFEGKIPREARSAAFVDFCAEHCRAMFPVSRWLLGLQRAG